MEELKVHVGHRYYRVRARLTGRYGVEEVNCDGERVDAIASTYATREEAERALEEIIAEDNASSPTVELGRGTLVPPFLFRMESRRYEVLP